MQIVQTTKMNLFLVFNGYSRHTLFAYDYCTPKKLFVTKITFKK